MKFLNLDKEYKYIDWIDALRPVFKRKTFINGPQVQQFEEQITEYLKVKYAIGVSSGTDALMVAIMATNIKNPTVLTTPYTFISTTEVPMRLGAKIIFCDIDQSFNINIQKAKDIISKQKIDIFLPVHLFGNPCFIDDELLNICKNNNTIIIEDAAQAFGACIKKNYVGTIGNMGCFSFFPSKNLGCAGDGGMIVTNDDNLYEQCKMIRNHGSKIKYRNEIHGGNFRLDSLQAALLSAKLPCVKYFIGSRLYAAHYYNDSFFDLKDVMIPQEIKGIHNTYNQYVLRIKKNRNKLRDYLKDRDIPTMLYYPSCLSEQPCYSNIDFQCECIESKRAAQENMAIPVGYLSKDNINIIINSIRDFYA